MISPTKMTLSWLSPSSPFFISCLLVLASVGPAVSTVAKCLTCADAAACKVAAESKDCDAAKNANCFTKKDAAGAVEEAGCADATVTTGVCATAADDCNEDAKGSIGGTGGGGGGIKCYMCADAAACEKPLAQQGPKDCAATDKGCSTMWTADKISKKDCDPGAAAVPATGACTKDTPKCVCVGTMCNKEMSGGGSGTTSTPKSGTGGGGNTETADDGAVLLARPAWSWIYLFAIALTFFNVLSKRV